MWHPLSNGDHALFRDSTLVFSGNGGLLGANLREYDNTLRDEMLNHANYQNHSFLYLSGPALDQRIQNALRLPGFERTQPGEYGEIDFGANGIPLPHTARVQPKLWLRSRGGKIGMAATLESLEVKMAGNQGYNPLYPVRKFQLIRLVFTRSFVSH